MRTSIDHLIDLAKLFSEPISLSKNEVGDYLVSIKHVHRKERVHSAVMISIFGDGETVEQACLSFLNKARGHLLIGDGNDQRVEYVCV